MSRTRFFLSAGLALALVGCEQTISTPTEVPDDDDTLADDDDDDAMDDDDAGPEVVDDDDDAVGDDDDAVGDDDDDTGSCAAVAPLICGNSVDGDTNSAQATRAIDAYSCSSWDESGPELIYSFYAGQDVELTVGFGAIQDGVDLDIWILEDDPTLGCAGEACVGYGDTSATVAAQQGDQLYVVVDGYAGAAGTFTLDVVCDTGLNPGDDDDDDDVGDDDDAAGDDDDVGPIQGVGDIIITEIMNNPAGADETVQMEWFEVKNTTAAAINLAGWTISDNGADWHVISGALVGPGGYLVLGQSTDTTLNGGAVVNYSYGADMVLANGDDEIILTDPSGVVVDEVAYDDDLGWPDVANMAKSLDVAALTGTLNDDPLNWCDTPAASYGAGGSGTPFGANPSCSATPAVDNDNDGFTVPADCDDNDAAVFPGAVEVLNGIDDDCDGQIDEGLTGGGNLNCAQPETEPNDAWTSADSMVPNSVACGAMDTPGDVDVFSFTAAAWEQITIDINAVSNGSNLDSFIQLLDDGGNLIADNDDQAAGNLDSYLQVTVAAAGTYHVTVTDLSGGGGVNYGYDVIVSMAPGCNAVELEPNDTQALADYTTVGGLACGSITSSLIFSDYDYFEFTALAGQTIDFDVAALSIGSTLAAQLELYDAAGTELASDNDNNPLFDPSITYTFATTGTYSIRITNDLYLVNDSGPYVIDIQ